MPKITIENAPVGTKAPAFGGGAWCKMKSGGWKWNGPSGFGGTFPSPGGDWDGRLHVPAQTAEDQNLQDSTHTASAL